MDVASITEDMARLAILSSIAGQAVQLSIDDFIDKEQARKDLLDTTTSELTGGEIVRSAQRRVSHGSIVSAPPSSPVPRRDRARHRLRAGRHRASGRDRDVDEVRPGRNSRRAPATSSSIVPTSRTRPQWRAVGPVCETLGRPARGGERRGHLDHGAAGGYQRGRLGRMMAVNAKGTFLVMRAVLPSMIARRAGTIINIASVAGVEGAELLSHYSASKFAVVGLTQAAAKEVARFGIRVNAVCPGLIRTAMQDREVGWEAELDRAARPSRSGRDTST